MEKRKDGMGDSSTGTVEPRDGMAESSGGIEFVPDPNDDNIIIFGGNMFRQLSTEETDIVERNDPVNHPGHYCRGGIECIDAIKGSMGTEAYRGFLKGNVMKYVFRYEAKNGLEDLKKAEWYLRRLIGELCAE